MLNIVQFNVSPIDDAMLEIQVLVGDAHAVYVRVGDILPDGYFSKIETFVRRHTWDPDQE